MGYAYIQKIHMLINIKEHKKEQIVASWIAASSAIDNGDTTEEAVNVNENTIEPVEKTELAETTEKLVNAIRTAKSYISTSPEETDEATNIEVSASDREKPIAEKKLLLPKVNLPLLPRLQLIWKS